MWEGMIQKSPTIDSQLEEEIRREVMFSQKILDCLMSKVSVSERIKIETLGGQRKRKKVLKGHTAGFWSAWFVVQLSWIDYWVHNDFWSSIDIFFESVARMVSGIQTLDLCVRRSKGEGRSREDKQKQFCSMPKEVARSGWRKNFAAQILPTFSRILVSLEYRN